MFVLLRIDDLLILAATATGFADASLCCNKRELLPFLFLFKHQTALPVQF